MFGLPSGLPCEAAQKLEVQFEGMSIPIEIKELLEWSRTRDNYGSELFSWLRLLDSQSRDGLLRLLNAPLLKDQSMGRQMLRSWVGRQLLDEVSDLIRLDNDSSGEKVIEKFESLLESQPEVSTLDLLEALPAKSIYLDLDALLKLASRWRAELKIQEELVIALRKIPSTSEVISATRLKATKESLQPSMALKFLTVDHREDPLSLHVWTPADSNNLSRSSWIVFMPGLGGSQDHFRWLAESLSREGWPVVVLQHPGSDAKAVQALLEGKRSAPGAEVLPDRLADLNSVLAAKKNGNITLKGEKVILMGHSLGALTSFLAAGAYPVSGLYNRCSKVLDSLALTNLSQLLQCQIVDVKLLKQNNIEELNAIVAINSFGSLLWPDPGDANIQVPLLLTGGTYDLITPPLSEQLGLLIATKPNLYSRVLLIEGASHFSPIRVEGQVDQKSGDDLFQLGEAIVGVQPVLAQGLLASEIIRFLSNLELGIGVETSIHMQRGPLKLHILDRFKAKELMVN